LLQRPDDNEDTVTKRIEVYEAQTAPLIDFYEAHGLLRRIEADAPLEQVTARVEQALAGVRESS
jgi:adenylate kinase